MQLRRTRPVVFGALALAACALTYLALPSHVPGGLVTVLGHYDEPPDVVRRTLRAYEAALPTMSHRAVVYTKGSLLLRGRRSDERVAVVEQPVNEGRLADVILTYIVDNYHALPSHMLFSVAAPEDLGAARRMLARFNGSDIMGVGSRADLADPFSTVRRRWCSCDGCFVRRGQMARLRDVYALATGRQCDDEGGFTTLSGGPLLVSRRAVLRHNLRFYAHLLELLHAPDSHAIHEDEALVELDGEPRRAGGRNDPLFGHVLDRAWAPIFGCFEPDVHLRCSAGPAAPVFQPDRAPEKTVWLLWLDGWHDPPWVVARVAASWRRLNPQWNVELLDAASAGSYAVGLPAAAAAASPQARSDLIRLHVLAARGGVWADATVACTRPLDGWLAGSLAPSGFWAYRGYGGWPPPPPPAVPSQPASWFMAARPHNALVLAWRDAADAFWEERTDLDRKHGPLNYFWMDALFKGLLANSTAVREAWERTPRVSCEDPHSSHWLAPPRMLQPLSREDERVLLRDPPYVLKLSWKGAPRSPARFTASFRRSALYRVLRPLGNNVGN